MKDKRLILESYLDFFKTHKFVITEAQVYDESEYTDGTGYRFEIYNGYDKTIKYVTITFKGMNAVDDPVRSSSSGGDNVKKMYRTY